MCRLGQKRYQGIGYTYKPTYGFVQQPEKRSGYYDPTMSGSGVKSQEIDISKAAEQASRIDFDGSGSENSEKLPGEALKQKLLKKMVKERKMTALGDRVKTSPIEAGFVGGNLVIPTKNVKMSSRSMSKTLPNTRGYKLSGSGSIVKHLQNSIVPILKKEKLLPPTIKNTQAIKKLIGIKARKIIKAGVKEPREIANKILISLKPVLSKVGGGVPMSQPALGLVAHKIAMEMKLKDQEGGFIIAGLIALGSAIAGAASAAAATTVVGSVTLGSLLGTALTGAAGFAGAEIMKKIMGGKGLPELKEKLVKAAKQVLVTIKDMAPEDKKTLKDALFEFSQNRNKAGAIVFAKKIAPIALKIAKRKLKPKVVEILKKKGFPVGPQGNGLSLAGSGLMLAGKGEQKFKEEFVKNLVKSLQQMK